jgi:uncharacterized protein YbjT (DUF2867 family)
MAEFQRVDLERLTLPSSIRATTTAALRAGASHIVYVSVAHPAPVMHAYIAARVEGEALVAATGIPATILRPWYVLGPRHRWPMLLLPLYALLRLLPATRESADRLGLVTQAQMTAALLYAVANPPGAGMRIVEVSGIRRAAP